MSDRTKYLLTFLGLLLAMLIFTGTSREWTVLGAFFAQLAWQSLLGVALIALAIGLWRIVRSRR